MLPELTLFENNKTTLISNTGIQFLDFGFALDPKKEPSGEFAKVTHHTLARLSYHPDDEINFYDKGLENSIENFVKRTPEFEVPLAASLELFNGHWLPLPFLRFIAPYRFDQGPANWARIRFIKLSQPDLEGNNYRVTLAFDTQLMLSNKHSAYLAPSPEDVSAGVAFKLAVGADQTNWFLAQEWVNSWLENIFKENSLDKDIDDLKEALECFEPQAHYLNLLSLITQNSIKPNALQTHKVQVPDIIIIGNRQQDLTKAIPVDLVLDIGNSRTCGILIEQREQVDSGLKHNYILQLRDLSHPERVYNHPFESRIEFSQANFGKENFAIKSGRNNAFLWPTIARVGSEANRLASQRSGTQGYTGISSPKRYLWDANHYESGWRFNSSNRVDGLEPHATAAPLLHYIDDLGEALYVPLKDSYEDDERLPVFTPHYSRRSLMTFMLSEVLTQALGQINSASQRTSQGLTETPRRLNSITLTVPPGMAQAERAILEERLNQAIALVWKALGWHQGDASPFDDTHPEYIAPSVQLPKTSVEWDEASCCQLVYLYTEINVHFGGHPEEFFKAITRPDKKQAAQEEKVTIATIDIGGGTSDLVITDYRLDRAGGNSTGSNVHIVPKQRFRDSFKVAGDDIVLDVIQEVVLPSFKHALKNLGLTDQQTRSVASALYGEESQTAQDEVYRQQLTVQVFYPIALSILKKYEQYDPEQQVERGSYTYQELMNGATASASIQEYVVSKLRNTLQRTDIHFDLHAINIDIDLAKLNEQFISGAISIMPALAALCEVARQYPCDILLLTGRPSMLPGIQSFIRRHMPVHPGRILAMQNYHTGGWYPFHQNGMINDPKTTASVGAMLCLLAANHNIQNFYFRSIDLKPYSTIRYFGVIDNANYISEGDVLFHNIQTVDSKMQLPIVNQGEDSDVPPLEFRGPVRLGYRQLPIARWSASPLYTLNFTASGIRKYNKQQENADGIPVLQVYFKVIDSKASKKSGIPSDELEIQKVLANFGDFSPRDLRLELNTMLSTDTNYWLDSGSVNK